MIDDPNNKNNPGQQPANFADDSGSYSSPEDRYRDSQAAQTDTPAVSAPAAKNFIFVGVILIIIIGVVYAFFSGGKPKPVTAASGKFQPVSETPGTSVVIPPPVAIPAPVPPPQPIVTENQPNNNNNGLIFSGDSSDRLKRIKSEMMVTRPGLLNSSTELGTRPDGANNNMSEINENDPNVGFADGFYNQKDAPYAQARKLGDMGRLITQGKIISSVLETPINTDIPGMIRAIVSHDVYAESGRVILIPKGSRLVGTYNNFVIRGNKRVNIIWTRVIRPDGIDIMIRSEASDQLGRAGIAGDVDNKYSEIFASAFLVSAINIALGAGVDAIDNKKTSTTTNTDGSTTTNSDAEQQAGIQAIDTFGNAGNNIINSFLNLKPTITINQGTRVNVFVNRDLIFPANMVGQVKFVK